MAHLEQKVDSTPVFEGKILRVRVDDVLLENGTKAKREVISHPGGVCVLAVDENDEVLLVRQFRYPFGRELIELPAGKLEYGEDHAACGRRELEEETGCTAETYLYLGPMYPTVAYDEEIIHLYYAAGLRPSRQKLDEGEFLDILRIPFSQALQMVLDGQLLDAKTQLALLKADALRRAGKI
ncbi:MAG: NUDIX hydrolase [Provencibacterium sp.]|nr:NUDIX hydrolase [Provencibacterium sp.]